MRLDNEYKLKDIELLRGNSDLSGGSTQSSPLPAASLQANVWELWFRNPRSLW